MKDLRPQCTVIQNPVYTTIHGHTEDRHPLVKWRKKMEKNIEKRNSPKFWGMIK